MLADALTCLVCPVCGSDLSLAGSGVVCEQAHAFDVARQGYLNFSSTGAAAGHVDTAEMVAARKSFLEAGYYEELASRLARLARELVPGDSPDGCVVDIGGGTGYFLACALDGLPSMEGIVLDRSKYAARLAAKAHPRISAVVADAWQRLPIRDGVAALALDVFAPRNAPELARIMRPDGALVVVTPNRDHLAQIVGVLGLLEVDPSKEDRLAEKLGPYFELSESLVLRRTLRLDRSAIGLLVAMGPSAWHQSADDLRAGMTALPEETDVSASFAIGVYRPKR